MGGKSPILSDQDTSLPMGAEEIGCEPPYETHSSRLSVEVRARGCASLPTQLGYITPERVIIGGANGSAQLYMLN